MDSGLPGSPIGGVYEVVGEVELVPAAQATPGPSQAAKTSRPQESGKALDRERTLELERIRSPPIRTKSTKCCARSGQVQSSMPERAPSQERARTPEKTKTPEWAKTPDRGKAPAVQVSHPPAPDCRIVEPWGQPPPLAVCKRRIILRERRAESNQSPWQSSRKKKKVPTRECSGSDDGS